MHWIIRGFANNTMFSSKRSGSKQVVVFYFILGTGISGWNTSYLCLILTVIKWGQNELNLYLFWYRGTENQKAFPFPILGVLWLIPSTQAYSRSVLSVSNQWAVYQHSEEVVSQQGKFVFRQNAFHFVIVRGGKREAWKKPSCLQLSVRISRV